MATDGKYLTLTAFKRFLGLSRTDTGNPTIYNGAVQGTPDDSILPDFIIKAETFFEQAIGGVGFDQLTLTNVLALNPFVDGNGLLHLFAKERGPVTAVSAIQIRDLVAGTGWKSVTWASADDLFLPAYQASDTHPGPDSWHVSVIPAQALPYRSTGQIMARWTYTGGFATIPQSLTNLIARMATFTYKAGREMPIGRIVNMQMGISTSPSNYPPDVMNDVSKWGPIYP